MGMGMGTGTLPFFGVYMVCMVCVMCDVMCDVDARGVGWSMGSS